MSGVGNGRPVSHSTPRLGSAHVAPALATFLVIVASVGLVVSWAGLPPAPAASPGPASPGIESPGATTPGTTPGTGATPTPGASTGPGATPSAPPEGWSPVELPPLPLVARLEPTRTVAAGVLADTAFRLTSLDGSDPAALARTLVADPPLEFSVTGTEGSTAVVQPAAPLRAGQAYRLALRDPDGTVRGTWAVQAVQPLHVVASVPGDQSTFVPLDTGIEITFDQDGVDLADASRFITITPSVEGTWVQRGRSVAFAPGRELRRGTLYTVTVRHGLPLAGTPMTLEEDAVVRFETKANRDVLTWVTLRSAVYDTPTGEGAIIAVNVDEADEEQAGDNRPSEVAVTAHRLPNLDAAVDAWVAIRQAPDWTHVTGTAPVATTGLPKVVDRTLRLHRFETDNDWRMWFRLPEIPAGWYVLTMREGDVPRQAVVQVTDIAVYTSVSETRTLAWVHDLATKAPLEGAKVGLLGTSLGTTDDDGLVVATTPRAVLAADEDPGPVVVTVRSSGRGAFVPIRADRLCEKCGADEWQPTAPWWVVFQPDRYAYRPTDTVNAWGVVRDRDTLDIPDQVTVRLMSDWGYTDIDAAAVASRTLTPDESGSFLAELGIRDLPYGQYELQVLVDGDLVASRTIDVDRIVKPAWTISLTTSRNALIAGETLRVTARARFFEGTPVAGATLRFTGGTTAKRATTGLLGSARALLRVGRIDDDSEEQWDVRGILVRPANPEEGAIRAETYVAVFRANVLTRVDASLDGDRLVATGSLHRVAWRRFDGVSPQHLWDVDPFGPRVPDRNVRVRVVEHHHIKTQTGTQYDFITKKSVPTYQYDTVTREILDQVVRTDAAGTFRIGLDVNIEDRDYEVIAGAADADGHRTSSRAWASPGDVERPPEAQVLRDDDIMEGVPYEVGDEVRLRFQRGAGTPTGGTYLWTVAQAGLREWRLTERARLRMPFGDEHVPSISIDAVRFTGRGYEVAWYPYLAAFDPAGRRLTVTITPDAARYAPGDRVSLRVRTTRPDGSAAAASVMVRVVDEKLYAMDLAADEDPLMTLYEPIGSGIVGTGWTHAVDSEWGDGWGDTTGGGSDRTEFRDWLLATLVRTGADGRATVTVNLSDDLTSWHVTAAGATSRLESGIGTALIPVGLPFFAEATIAPEYLKADRPVIALRGFGSALDADDVVTFRVSSDTLPMAAVTVKAKAFLPAEVALPELSVGTHRIRIVATTTAGGRTRTDALVRAFTVVAARQVRTTTTTVALTGATPVERGIGATTLIVADGGRGRVVPVLDELRWADPARVDRALAAALAVRLLRDELGVNVPEVVPLQGELDRFRADEGIAIVPWSSGELELTVLTAMADDPRLPAAGLAGYFEPREIDPEEPEAAEPEEMTPERQAWTLAGRAATGSMVIAEVRALAAQRGLTVETRVALSLAALLAGDEELAGRLERDVLAETGLRMGPWVSLHTGDEDRDAVLTARLAIVAAALGDPLAPDMDAFVADNPPTATVVDLERALAARGWISRTPAASASAVLVVDGVRTTLAVEASRPRLVTLTPAQARTATLEPGSGQVVVTTTTTTAYRDGTLERPDGLRLSVRVQPGTTVDADDLVVVTYTVRLPKRPTGCWVLTDMVPSGLMPFGGGGDQDEDEDEDEGGARDTTVRPESVTGQAVRFCLYADPDKQSTTVTARYLARVVTPGRYRWEPAVLQSSLAPDLGMATDRRTLVIGRLTR